MKTYLIINPFNSNASHGIHNYNTNLAIFLEANSVPFEIFSNDSNLSPDKFRLEVKKYVESKYGYDEVLIEAPEVKAATLLLDDNYTVHVRLHTPGAIAQKYDNAEINQSLFKEELEAIAQADLVSAPSYGIVKELEEYINRKDFSIYKNPFNLDISVRSVEKKYDIVFMARFQKLKGIEFLNPILERLPSNYRVLLFGNNSNKFKLSNKVNCKVDIEGHIAGEERFDLIMDSKHLLQLSKFENCSMVILEGLACHTIVHAWDVGGNKEIADNRVLKISPFENVDYLVKQLLDFENTPNLKECFKENLDDIHQDFINGFENIIHNHSRDDFKPYKGINKQDEASYNTEWLLVEKQQAFSHTKAYNNFGKRIFGFSMSNEHIEEFWMPIIEKMNSDYRFVCARPLGFMYKFNNPYYVDPSKFTQYDWMRYPNLLIEDIKKFKPHKIFFHNGSHPMYYEVLGRVKKAFPNIPIVYSELGWFPQQDNVYFDTEGVNGLSSISKMDFMQFCGRNPVIPAKEKLSGNVVIVTQLENDTNLIINSNRFKSMEKFVEYCLLNIPNKEKVIIKLHPLENYPERFLKFESSRVKVVLKGDLNEILKKSKAVIGINSTVLLESLQFNTNVYYFGGGVISNKGVAIDCTNPKVSLKEIWTDYVYSSQEDRDTVVNTFKSLQIHLPSLQNLTVAECLELPSFKPLTTSVAKYSNFNEFQMVLESRAERPGNRFVSHSTDIKTDIQEIKDIVNGLPSKFVTQVIDKNEYEKPKTKLYKKVRKLKNNPFKFFDDSNKAGSKIISSIIHSLQKRK